MYTYMYILHFLVEAVERLVQGKNIILRKKDNGVQKCTFTFNVIRKQNKKLKAAVLQKCM